MRPKALGSFFHSVFTQLTVICLAAGTVIVLLVAAFFSHLFRESAQAHLQKNVTRYVNYVVTDLGTPPSFEKAKEISRESGMQIRYEGARGGWTTSAEVPPLAELKRGRMSDCFALCRIYRHKYPIVVAHGSDRFIVTLRPEHTTVNGWELQGVVLVALVSGVFLIAYLAIRHILKPLKLLNEGVRQIGEGKLEYRVQPGPAGEFAELAEAFNAMTVRIRNMLHAKEQLLLDVSHELRSPLTRMKVALAMQQESQTQRGLSEEIREMETMVSEILEEARLRHSAGDLRVEPVAVAELFREMGEIHEGEAPGLRIGTVPETASFHGDPPLIKIVLKNVIANALKYSAPDGEPVWLGYGEIEGRAVVTVQDRGVGVPEEDLPHIFEPFYRVDKSRSKRTGGYGLGLSLCKAIMDAHGGEIEVKSSLRVGTSISLLFRK